MMSERLDAVTIPKWGIEMTHGTIVAWHKKVGDTVAAGEDIVDIETDKIVNSFEARTSGTLVRILAEIGAELPVGQLIGVIAPELVPEAAVDAFVAAQGAAVVKAAVGGADAAALPATSAASSGTAVKISPALRRKLESAGLNAEQVTGTGPRWPDCQRRCRPRALQIPAQRQRRRLRVSRCLRSRQPWRESSLTHNQPYRFTMFPSMLMWVLPWRR